MNLNKVFLIGRLTADPVLRSTPSGQSVGSFSVATNRTWTEKSGAKQESAEFHNIVVWGRRPELASQYLKKGAMALIEGRLQTRSWQNKEGQNMRTTEVIAERIQFGPSPMNSGMSDSGGSSFSRGGARGKDTSQENDKLEELPTIDMDDTGDIKPE